MHVRFNCKNGYLFSLVVIIVSIGKKVLLLKGNLIKFTFVDITYSISLDIGMQSQLF